MTNSFASDLSVPGSGRNILDVQTHLRSLADRGFIWCGTSSGAANAFEVSSPDTFTALPTGIVLAFTAHQSSTASTPTFKVDALSAVNLVDGLGNTLETGHVLNGETHYVLWDGTSATLLNPAFGEWSPTWSASGSMTFSGITDDAWYRVVGNVFEYHVYATGTIGGSADVSLFFTIPSGITLPTTDTYVAGSGMATETTLNFTTYQFIQDADEIAIRFFDNRNYATGSTKRIRVRGIIDGVT